MNEAKKLLIIDDDRDFVRAIAALFESSGYNVESAGNGRQGLELAKRLQPDLILLDVMMDERTEGFFTLQEIRRIDQLKSIPVIVISSIYSAHPNFNVDPEDDWLPAELFLGKPVDPGRLFEEAERLISGSPSSATIKSLSNGSAK